MKEHQVELSYRVIELLRRDCLDAFVDEKINFIFSRFGIQDIYPVNDNMKELRKYEIRPRFLNFKEESENLLLKDCSQEKILGAIIEYDLYVTFFGHLKQDSAEVKQQHRITQKYLQRFLEGGNFSKAINNGMKDIGHGLRGDFMVDSPNKKLYSNRTEETLAIIESHISPVFQNLDALENNEEISLWDHIVCSAFFGTLFARTNYRDEHLINLDDNLLKILMRFGTKHSVGIKKGFELQFKNKTESEELPIEFSTAQDFSNLITDNIVLRIRLNEIDEAYAAPMDRKNVIIFFHNDHESIPPLALKSILLGTPGMHSYRDPKRSSIRMLGDAEEAEIIDED